MGAGLLGAVRTAGGGVGALSVRATTPISARVQLSAVAGVFADTDGKISARDLSLNAPVLLVNQPQTQLRIAPGVSLPLGSTTAGLEYTLLTTGSFDPTLSIDFAAGSGWVFLAGGSVRTPLHPGFDRIRQGIYARSDVRLARRFGSGAGFAGLSVAGQQTRGLTSPGFAELAATMGASVPLSDQWGSEISLRVPFWTDAGQAPYYGALRVGVTRVFGKPRVPPH